VLDAVEEALVNVPLPVEPAGERKALLAVGARRDVGPGILAGGGFANGVAVVAFVGEQRRALRQSLQQGLGFLAVVDLTAVRRRATGQPSPKRWL
jgi:hypothetical protein